METRIRYIFPDDPLYDFNPDNSYHKKLLEKTGDDILVINNYDDIEKHSGNRYGEYLMKMRGDDKSSIPKIPNITIEKTERGYIVRGNPEPGLLEAIKKTRYKLPNGKIIKCIRRKLPKGDGWIIQENCIESVLELIKESLPEEVLERSEAREDLKKLAMDFLEDSRRFTDIRDGGTLKPVDILYAMKDMHNRADLLKTTREDIPEDFSSSVKSWGEKHDYRITDGTVKMIYTVCCNSIDGNTVLDEEFIDKFIRLYSSLIKRYPNMKCSKLCIFILELIFKDPDVLTQIKMDYIEKKEKLGKVKEESKFSGPVFEVEPKKESNDDNIETSENFAPYYEDDVEITHSGTASSENSEEESEEESEVEENLSSSSEEDEESSQGSYVFYDSDEDNYDYYYSDDEESSNRFSDEIINEIEHKEDEIEKQHKKVFDVDTPAVSIETTEKDQESEEKIKIDPLKDVYDIHDIDSVLKKLNELDLDENCKRLVLSALTVVETNVSEEEDEEEKKS
jgi:hypothetical protein